MLLWLIKAEERALDYSGIRKAIAASLIYFAHSLLHLLQTKRVLTGKYKVVVQTICRSSHLKRKDVLNLVNSSQFRFVELEYFAIEDRRRVIR